MRRLLDPDPIPTDPSAIGAGLRAVRLRRRQQAGALLLYAPVVVFAGYLYAPAAPVVWAVWMATIVWALTRVGLARCPRCGRHFHAHKPPQGLWMGNPWTGSCMNCGLPLRSERDPAT